MPAAPALFRQEEKTIGNHSYKVTVLDAVTGRRTLVRLSKIVGPALANLANGDITGALSRFVADMSEADLDHFVELFEPRTVVTGGNYSGTQRLSGVSTTHFVDNYFELVEWLTFCLDTNFRSFFVGAKTLLQEQAAKKAAEKGTGSSSEKESTGTSGA